jgi:hypothetical protein
MKIVLASTWRVLVLSGVITGHVACGGDDGPATVDAATSTADAATTADAPGGFSTCEGTCQTTALTATFGQTTRVLDRAYYGISKTPSGSTLFVEAYRNAPARCPEESDPPPDYTLVLGSVPIPTEPSNATSPGNLLDFKGDLLGGDLGRRADTVMLMAVAANVCAICVGMPAPSDPDGMIAFDAALGFPGGTVAGHLYATHCDSLDSLE